MTYLSRLIKGIRQAWLHGGFKGILRKVPAHIKYLFGRHHMTQRSYKQWIKHAEALMRNDYMSQFPSLDQEDGDNIKFSILMPLWNADLAYLKDAVASIYAQTYENWELCVHNDGSDKHLESVEYIRNLAKRDSRIKFSSSEENGNISHATNKALELATGKYVLLMDQDDTIDSQALEIYARTLKRDRRVKFIYSDEDKLSFNKADRCEPIFKPDWSPNYILSMMYTTHLGCYNYDLFKQVGAMRIGFEGAQDYDLVLRITEVIEPSQIQHIPLILYHWRKIPGSTAERYEEKSWAKQAARKALKSAVKRRKLAAYVQDGLTPISFRVKYKIKGNPLISIIIPTWNHKDLLERCILSIEQFTDYNNYEIIIVDNNTDEPDAVAYLQELGERYTVLRYNKPFNFSAINNFAVKHANGEHVLLLNNDTEAIQHGWLQSMLELSQQPHIGAVGALLLYPNNKIQHAGLVLGIGGVAGHAFRNYDYGQYTYLDQAYCIRDVSAVTAACLMVKKEIYNEVNGLEETLRVAFNDVDFCLKIREAGYRNVYTPFAKLYHHESPSRGSDETPERRNEFQKEVLYMKDKWGDLLQHDPYYNPNLTLEHENYSLRW